MPFTLHRIHYVESMSCSSMSCNSMSCPIPVLYVEFDFLQFDLKSTNFEDPKKTSNKIRRIVNSVISVYKEVYSVTTCFLGQADLSFPYKKQSFLHKFNELIEIKLNAFIR